MIKKALKAHNGNVTKTADALGISRQSLQYRLRKLNIHNGRHA
ncbi:helix-turn-helix domain-containing protein [Novibacillus thermophilus]|nr:helix-turn-helix domain-containing protein [Novibacillus thermophilus]